MLAVIKPRLSFGRYSEAMIVPLGRVRKGGFRLALGVAIVAAFLAGLQVHEQSGTTL